MACIDSIFNKSNMYYNELFKNFAKIWTNIYKRLKMEATRAFEIFWIVFFSLGFQFNCLICLLCFNPPSFLQMNCVLNKNVTRCCRRTWRPLSRISKTCNIFEKLILYFCIYNFFQNKYFFCEICFFLFFFMEEYSFKQ